MGKHIYKIIFCVFVVVYFLAYGFYGYNDADDGFTLALSWRIFNGEIPYRDFFLIRPPISPLFHSISLYIIPANWQILFERFLFYAMLASASLFGSLTIYKLFRLEELKIDIFLLATVGFVFSAHNFPPMPWYTVDGVFFASVGIFLLIKYSSSFSIISGILFLFISAMCKQSFYLMPFAGIAYVIITHKSLKKALVSVISLCIYICVFIFILFKAGALTNFIVYTSASANIKDLIRAGVFRYSDLLSIYFILPFAVLLLMKKLPNVFKSTELFPYISLLFFMFFPLAKFIILKYHLFADESSFLRDDIAVILLIIGIFYIISNYSFSEKWNGLILLILLSWSAGVSWGHPTPVFFSVPLIFIFFHLSVTLFSVVKIKKLIYFTLAVGTLTYFIAYQYPYCNPTRNNLKYELTELFPKLSHIKVGQNCFEKYTEFNDLIKKYGKNFKTLPGMPLANYLTDTRSPIGVDWVVNAETVFRNEYVINELEKKQVVIFLEKHPQLMTVMNNDDINNSSVAYFIKSNWLKIDSTNNFEVFKSK